MQRFRMGNLRIGQAGPHDPADEHHGQREHGNDEDAKQNRMHWARPFVN
jgi:hypothetical protein